MKKIFTLFAGLLVAAAVMAARPGPSVTITSSKNYRIVVDGKSYFGSRDVIRLHRLSPGLHQVKVFEMRKGLFVKGEKLVSSSTFKLGKKDVSIRVDASGRISVIKKKGHGRMGRKGQARYMNRQAPVRRF